MPSTPLTCSSMGAATVSAHRGGVGARIEGRYQHSRRRDLRVLSHRQREHRYSTRQNENDGDDRGEDRTIDKEADHACGPPSDSGGEEERTGLATAGLGLILR